MIRLIVFFVFNLCLVFADDLPSLEQIKNTNEAPVKIKPTGKRETLEPIVNGKVHGLGRYYHPNGQRYAVIPWENGKKKWFV